MKGRDIFQYALKLGIYFLIFPLIYLKNVLSLFLLLSDVFKWCIPQCFQLSVAYISSKNPNIIDKKITAPLSV